MGQPNPHNPRDRIEVDPNAEKKMAEILKEALSTRSSRHGCETNREKPPHAAQIIRASTDHQLAVVGHSRGVLGNRGR